MSTASWSGLSIGEPMLDQTTNRFKMKVVGEPIPTPPLKVVQVNDNSVVCEFNPSFAHFYEEVYELYETIANIMYDRRFDIFQLDVPLERIRRLLASPIKLPSQLKSPLLLHIRTADHRCKQGEHYIFTLEFDSLILTPTDIHLNLHANKDTINRSSTVFVDPVEDSITDSDYDG